MALGSVQIHSGIFAFAFFFFLQMVLLWESSIASTMGLRPVVGLGGLPGSRREAYSP